MIFALNAPKTIDIIFFGIILGIVALVLILYFLVPFIMSGRYERQQEALREREKLFKENLEKNQGSILVKGKKVEDKEE